MIAFGTITCPKLKVMLLKSPWTHLLVTGSYHAIPSGLLVAEQVPVGKADGRNGMANVWVSVVIILPKELLAPTLYKFNVIGSVKVEPGLVTQLVPLPV